MSIYKKALELMNENEIDNHNSDLYLKKTVVSDALISEYGFKENVKTFKDNINGEIWYDIPFEYEPWWSKRW